MVLMLLLVVDCEFIGNGMCCAMLTTPIHRLICSVIYWYLWTVLIPRLGGYRLEEEADVLQDGTSVTKLVKVKNT